MDDSRNPCYEGHVSGKNQDRFASGERGESTAALRERLDYEEEGVRIAEERLAQLERGEAKLVPLEEALRSLGR